MPYYDPISGNWKGGSYTPPGYRSGQGSSASDEEGGGFLPWKGRTGPNKVLEDIMRMTGIGLLLSPAQIQELPADYRNIVAGLRIPRTYTRKYGENLLRGQSEDLAQAQQARSRDLQGTLSRTVGLRSGMAAEAQRQNAFQEAAEIARMQTALEKDFREARIRELLERLSMVQSLFTGQKQLNIAQDQAEGDGWIGDLGAGLGAALGAVAGFL